MQRRSRGEEPKTLTPLLDDRVAHRSFTELSGSSQYLSDILHLSPYPSCDLTEQKGKIYAIAQFDGGNAYKALPLKRNGDPIDLDSSTRTRS